VLVFIDETWQKIGTRDVGALGAVAIPQSAYDGFCREVFAWKSRILGAVELNDKELKGTNLFAKAAFRREALHGDSTMLAAAREVFGSLRKYRANAFVVWTHDPSLLTLRNPSTTSLSDPYKALLYDLRGFLRAGPTRQVCSLNFDQRTVREDEGTACAVQNLLVRSSGDWRRRFMHVPNFTVSSVSPGLQSADVITYLGPFFSDEAVRPELHPYLEQLRQLARFRARSRLRTCIREVAAREAVESS
jgi:hypothetical protein